MDDSWTVCLFLITSVSAEKESNAPYITGKEREQNSSAETNSLIVRYGKWPYRGMKNIN